jgi:hypothetical protein
VPTANSNSAQTRYTQSLVDPSPTLVITSTSALTNHIVNASAIHSWAITRRLSREVSA